MTKALLRMWPLALFVLAAWALYGQAGDHLRLPGEEGLVWENPAVAGGEIGQILLGRWQADGYRPQVRPLATLVRALEHALYSFQRGGYQIDQILLHGVVATLVFALLRGWLGSLSLGLMGGLLFLAHPALTHSVLSLGGLSEILATALILGALLVGGQAASPRPRERIALGVLAFLAMLAKEIAFLLPLGALVAIAMPGADRRQRLARFGPILIAGAAALLWRIIALLATPEPIARIPAIDPTTALPIFPLLVRSIGGVLVEASLVIAPLTLSHDYSWLFPAGRLAVLLLALGGLALIAGGGWFALRRGTRAEVSTLAALAILPLAAAAVLVVPTGSVASERNLYLALPGWIGLALWGARRLSERRLQLRGLLIGIGAGLLLAFVVRTSLRLPQFESQETLVAADLASRPSNPQILFESGNLKLSGGDREGAVRDYEQAIALRPDFPMASLNLAVARIGQDEFGLALRILDPLAVRCMHVRSLRMVDARAHYHAGLVLQQQDRPKAAAEAFERMLLFYPDHLGARGNLGLIYVRAPQYAERGLDLLRGAIAEERDPARRTNLQKAVRRAEELLRDYVDEHGELPSERESPAEGVLGEPWKTAAAQGL